MEMKVPVLAITVALFFSSCKKQDIENESLTSALMKSSQIESAQSSDPAMKGNMKGQVVLNFRAHLSGDNEVPPRETLATGQAIFQLSKDGMELRYKILVAGLDNITMAHIHVASAGSNGPVVTWLYPAAPPAKLIAGTTNGILQEGVIRKANLIGSLAGRELSDLVDLLVADKTYVNVHTTRYPGGEIRGQIFGNVKDE